jgi:hypothetical protein
MRASGDESPPALEKALRQIEELTSALYRSGDTNAREAARELLEVVLDLHGLGLARMVALVAAAEEGAKLTGLLAADPYARAIMLLHGLHPLTVEERLREAISQMTAKWSGRGVEIRLVRAGPATAEVRIVRNGAAESAELLADEVERRLIDAAPDLDGVRIDVENGAVDEDEGRRVEA